MQKSRRVLLSVEVQTTLPIATLRKIDSLVFDGCDTIYRDETVGYEGGDSILQVQVNVVRGVAQRNVARGTKRSRKQARP